MSVEYYKLKESVDEYIRLAEGFNGDQIIKKLKRFLPAGSYLLEIGSGPGTDWKNLNQYYEVVGSDYSVEFLKRLKTTHPNANFIELNATTLKTDKKFTGIYSNKVLHHLRDEELKISINRQYEILNSDGIICHSFWKGEGTEVYNGLFVNYHTDHDIHNFFGDYFEILSIESYKEFEKDDSIFLIGKKK